MNYLKPIAVKKDSFSIGIVQLSDAEYQFPHRYNRALNNLIRHCGRNIRDYSEYSKQLNNKDNRRELALRFHKAIEENDLVISLTGGYTTNCILPFLDFDRISELRRPIVGYSDTTALLLAILAKSGMSSLYGPALLGSFGEYPDINDYTLTSFLTLVFTNSCGYIYPKPEMSSESNYYWDQEDNRKMKYSNNRKWMSNDTGTVEGILYGGNLNTLLQIAGTEYYPDVENGLLFVEETFTSIGQLKRDIESMRQRGILNEIRGILFGKFFQSGTQAELAMMNDYVLDIFAEMGIPAMTDVDFGHGSPHLSIPLGVRAQVDFSSTQIVLSESFCDAAG